MKPLHHPKQLKRCTNHKASKLKQYRPCQPFLPYKSRNQPSPKSRPKPRPTTSWCNTCSNTWTHNQLLSEKIRLYAANARSKTCTCSCTSCCPQHVDKPSLSMSMNIAKMLMQLRKVMWIVRSSKVHKIIRNRGIISWWGPVESRVDYGVQL